MHHTGTLFMSKTRPIVAKGADGSFRLELALVDNMGRNPATGRDEKEGHGPAAEHFPRDEAADVAGERLDADMDGDDAERGKEAAGIDAPIAACGWRRRVGGQGGHLCPERR